VTSSSPPEVPPTDPPSASVEAKLRARLGELEVENQALREQLRALQGPPASDSIPPIAIPPDALSPLSLKAPPYEGPSSEGSETSRAWSSSDGTPVPSFSFTPDHATVLVVDDASDLRRFVAHVLRQRYRVITASDGVEGLKKIREEHPDLVVSDVRMERMDGIELCRAIRGDPGLARTPVILLSAVEDFSRKIEGLLQGADDYLVKPFNASELLTRARNLIRLHHQERELVNALRALEERERILSEDLRQAREFQQSILPTPPRVPGLSVDVLYRPLGAVGGDIYDIQALEDGRLRVFLADATGHGVQASLTTMLIKSEYEAAKRDDASPAEVLSRLNDRIALTYPALGVRFTAACFEVDKKQRRVLFSTGAHPAPLLLHNGYGRELESDGPFLGLESGVTFRLHEAPFGPGDRFYLYTDGLTDEWNALGEEFGDERLRQTLEAAADQGALAGTFVYDQVSQFIEGGADQYDDMTLLGVWWGQPPGYDKEKQ